MPILLALSSAQKRNGLVSLVAALSLALGVAGLAGAAPAAAEVTCPTVDPSTGAVTPAPASGVFWAGCDLSGADLSGADLYSANLSTANLAGANLNGANLTLAILSSSDLTGADLTNAKLNAAFLDGTIFAGATLTGVSSGSVEGTPASLPASWILVNGCLVGPGAQLRKVSFGSSDLSGADLSGADLTSASFDSANLTGADLSDANLTLITMSGTDLTDANLSGANLTDGSMGGVTLTGAMLTGATLTGFGGFGIAGTPTGLPGNWNLIAGYLVGPGANLSHADLSGLDLSGLDLTDVNFYGASLGNANLVGVTLTGAQSGKVTGVPAVLPADWSISSGYLIGPGADLQGALLANASLSAADLAGANLDQAQMSGANLTGATLTSASLAQAQLPQAILTSADLAGADADGAMLYQAQADHADLAAANLTGADLPDASLTSANLAGAHLGGADLNGALLDGADLTSADLTGVILEAADLTSAKLAESTLTGASGFAIIGSPASMPLHWSVRRGYLIGPGSTTYMTDADLSNLNLSGVDFTDMDLLRATFRHSNLTGANLTGANLAGVDFTSANLTRADLRGAKVSSTWFVGTLWDDTTCPNGSKSSTHKHGWCFPPPPSSGFAVNALPRPPGGSAGGFVARALSCPSATLCYGGGNFTELSATTPSQTFQAVLMRWQDGHWLVWPAPFPPGVTRQPAAMNAVAAMSCPSARMCVAGGSYGNQGLLLTWFGKKWTALKAPLPAAAASDPSATVAALSCPSLAACFAAGGYMGRSREMHGLVLRWNGRIWRAAAAPLPAGSRPDQFLAALSCPSAGLCFAGGWQNDATQQSHALMVARYGGAWHPVNVPLPADAAAEPHAEISGLACPAVTRCVAVGSYTDAAGHGQGLLLTLSGTHWTAARAPHAWGAAGNPEVGLNAVSCPVTSRCTVVGTYRDTAGQSLGLVLTWSGKAWRAVPAPLVAHKVRAISCPTVTRCVALGDSDNNEIGLVGP